MPPDKAGYRVDFLRPPEENPWQRHIPPTGITFLPDGTALVCTVDGHVWIVSGAEGGEAG